ncbi:hypothetical protein ACET3Z_011118 [Daucus carota]
MVSNSELVKRLHEILSTSDLNTTTTGIVRRKLEEELGVSLSDKKAFIREQVDLYLQSHFEQQQEEEPNQEQQVEQEQETEEQGEEEEELNQEQQVEQEEEETEEQEEDGSGDEKAPLTRTRPKKQKKKVKRKGGGGGFAKVCSLSPELQNFTGVSKLPRTEVVKQMWNYIREKELQEPSDRRTINCDDALRALFNVDSINMFQMNKALAKHIWPLESNGEEQEEGEAEVADEEGSDDDKATIKSKKQNKNVKGKGSGGSGGGGFKKVCSLSPELQKFTGVPELPRTEVVKQLWSYIKENNLQDPSDRRNIICDDSLRVLFNVDSINMFQMNKALAKHIRPLDSDASVNSTPKEKQLKHEREDSDVPKRKEKVPKRKEKRQKSCDTEEVATIPLSDALVKFLGTGETSLSRSDVIKRIWEYINQNNLQDPFDTGRIISDEKLKELFEVDAFNGLAVTKLLKSHFVKAEK